VVSYESFNYFLRYTSDDIVLRVPKLFFHYARDNGFLFPLRSGAAVVLFAERTTAALMFELIRKYRPTVLLNVPTMMRAMIQTPKHERADLGCLRRNISSGELLSAQLYEEWINTFGSEVIDRLGSAESGMGYLCNRPGTVVPGSSGTVTPLAEIKLVDNEGLEVPRGQPGVLMTRSEAAGLYYVREHEKSKTTFLGNEWINTGDLFMQDENDYFWYVGRADEMVKVSGVWVSPLEIERGLQECPSVKEAVALGIKDKDGLIKIKAFVVLREGAKVSAEMEDELKRFCKERLAPHKFPSAIELTDELPKTGQGKIDRRLLRERAL
ncbi:MAG: AMP-binding protein, partial [Candidatus Binatia bacterium]